ncbi:MAG: hypothetical protein ACX931_04840 [Saccharospirillum sp.]
MTTKVADTSARNVTMRLKFLIFLLIVVVFVGFLVYVEQRRQQPWNSDVFFGQSTEVPTDEGFEGQRLA